MSRSSVAIVVHSGPMHHFFDELSQQTLQEVLDLVSGLLAEVYDEVPPFTLFGGALRDLILKRALHRIDVRVIVSDSSPFFQHLFNKYRERVQILVTIGSSHERCYLTLDDGVELELSSRPSYTRYKTETQLDSSTELALDRVMGSDLGLCAIAVSSFGHVMQHSAFVQDVTNGTLTVMHDVENDRVREYTERMKLKFDINQVVYQFPELQLGGEDDLAKTNLSKVEIII